MSRPTLLAFFAHPDDEAFSCSGTLALAASRQIDVIVACATRGERGQARDGQAGDLASRRSDELARSCQVLGARAPRFLDLPDGELAAHRDTLEARLADLLQAIRPDAAITMGPDGAYGHLDHAVCAEVLAEAAGRAAAAATLLQVVFPPGLFDDLRRRLERAAVVPLSPHTATPSADYRVDIRSAEQRKLASIGAHRSQLSGGDPRSFLVPGLVDRLLAEECFHHAGGPRLEGPLADLFGAD